MKKHTILVLVFGLLAGCAGPMEAPPGDDGGVPEWVPAACEREHDVVTRYRNATGQVTLIVTETRYFEDIGGDVEDTLVRTCNAAPTTEWGCPLMYGAGVSCIGDEEGPWPLCTVGFPGTDADGNAIIPCGVRITRESVDGPSGQITQTSVTPNPVTVETRGR